MIRRYSAVMALGGLILLGGGAASASAADLLAVRARVPFTFKAGGATLPPGEYFFRFDGVEQPGILRVHSRDGRGGAFVLMQKAEVSEGSGDQPQLRFEKDENDYVLSQVLDPGINYGIEVVNTRPRGEPERSEAPTD
jgi:hypothetical protein